MTDLILHQYTMSPFSIKVIKILAHKGLAWHGVAQPMIAPKPDLTPLTGGYRRIPVLQVGAHIYCDTTLILRHIERLHPSPPCTPAAQQGAADIIADWADHRMFSHAAMPTVFEALEALPPKFLEDRAAMQPANAGGGLPVEHSIAQFQQDCLLLERQLAATPFLLGDGFTLADAAAFHVVNFTGAAPSMAKITSSLPKLSAWLQRIHDMGEGERSDISPEQALEIARAASPGETPPVDAIADATLPIGAKVRIQPDDYGQEVTLGEIVWTTTDELAVKRHDEAVGEVMVHYPRAGYLITLEPAS
jgi:glutathione S-transferase